MNLDLLSSSSVLTYTAGAGAGLTISALHFNVFEGSTLRFRTPAAGMSTAPCTQLSYKYIDSIDLYMNGKRIYIAFCPLDQTFDLSSINADIQIINPRFSSYFV
jgi:hypothetical protein